MRFLRITLLVALTALQAALATAADFETATSAVARMKVGWNLGNTLDANSGSLDNMWIEAWTDRTTSDYETAWGQPVATRELIHMMKMAGFNAIRVPVTWWPHMEATFNSVTWNSQTQSLNLWDPETDPIGTQIDEVWMARVQEVVDYVIDEGMYCILNVHHDTGTYSTSWIKASMDNYYKKKDTFAAIWTQIANRFKDYGEKLIFEGYNEVLDPYDSWCYSSLGMGSYNATVANDAYNAINSYAQLFVNTVRATGGNNAQRNLALCTYAAAPGAGTWNSHLQDPLKNMALPNDNVSGHIMFEVHSYLETDNINNCKATVDQMLRDINTYLAPKGPIIFGEWGTADGKDYYNDYRSNTLEYCNYFVKRATEYGFCTLYWMGLSDGQDRTVPQFTKPDMVSSITKGYYGDNFDYTNYTPVDNSNVTYALKSGETFTSGQTVPVYNGEDGQVATITYGESGGADFKAATSNGTVSGYVAFTEGNGTNGNDAGGTFYTITPAYDGTISVAVVLNAGKAFYIEENGVAMDGYNGIKVSSKYYGTYTFDVKGGRKYKIYCSGSKLGFYGFNYTYEVGKVTKIRGDLNYDGIIGIVDVTLLVDIILNGGQPDLEVADVNQDGIISISDVTKLVNIILGVVELTTEPTAAPNKPTTAASDVLLSVFSDTYGYPIPNIDYMYPGGWYHCTVTQNPIDGVNIVKAVYEDADDTWTGQAGFWQTNQNSQAAGAKKVYLTAFSADETQLTIEIMTPDYNDGNPTEVLAKIVMPMEKGKWNYLSASVEGYDLSIIGNVSVRAATGTLWFTDLYFSK
ncbi:MAG: cellulase family glycosylhydrolase [Prevotella sp.]|nr:cellulase family glycosylhydrolase [Prevotella sp.]